MRSSQAIARLRLPVIASEAMHGVVDVEFAPGELAELLRGYVRTRGAVDLMDQAGTGDRAGIDHRVERPVVVGQPDRIERLAARLDADGRRHALFADHVQRQRKHEGLGDRLDGERHRAVADFIDMAVDGDERDAEMRGIGALQLGNVVGDRAGIVRLEFLVTAGQEMLQRRLVGVAGISGGEVGFGRANNLGVHNSSPLNRNNRSNIRAMDGVPTAPARLRLRHPDALRHFN